MVDADGATKFEDIEKLECAATNLRKKNSKVNIILRRKYSLCLYHNYLIRFYSFMYSSILYSKKLQFIVIEDGLN